MVPEAGGARLRTERWRGLTAHRAVIQHARFDPRSKKRTKQKNLILRFLVPEAGVEPARYRYHWILSPARLPIPSFRHMLF